MLTASDINDATHAVILSAPRRTNRRRSGIAATTALQVREWAMGSRTCWYTGFHLCQGERSDGSRRCGTRHTRVRLPRLGVVLILRVVRSGADGRLDPWAP